MQKEYNHWVQQSNELVTVSRTAHCIPALFQQTDIMKEYSKLGRNVPVSPVQKQQNVEFKTSLGSQGDSILSTIN